MMDASNTVSDWILDQAGKLGVTHVFGIPGGALEPFFNALARSERAGGPRIVVARHETGAAFMAEGYARETGKIGVCCATTGPGATNLITGVMSARTENIPLLVITAQTALKKRGRRAFQESSCTGADSLALFDPCTVYNTLVSSAEELPHKLCTALMTARQQGGPAHLAIPTDVLDAPMPEHIQPAAALPDIPACVPDSAALDFLAGKLAASRKTVLVVGEGCRGASEEIIKLSEMLNALMISTPQGKMWVQTRHPLYRGVFGFSGHATACEALKDPEVDTILLAGSRLDEWDTDGWNSLLLNNRLVHLDSRPCNFCSSPAAGSHLAGDLSATLRLLSDRLSTGVADPGHRRAEDGQKKPVDGVGDPVLPGRVDAINPAWLMQTLVENLPPETRFLCDTGNSFAWSTHYLNPKQAGTYRVSMSFASMGWAIGAAVGTARGNPNVPTVCITGDGAFLMSGQEITVAVAEKLPVIFVILTDLALGMVKHGQRLGGAERIGFEVPPVDFAKMAEALGATGHLIRSPDDLLALDWEALAETKGPVLLDVRIDPELAPPIKTHVKRLGFGCKPEA